MKDCKAVLFDLDDTLLDRAGTFSLYCDYLMDSFLPGSLSDSEKEGEKQFLLSADKNGYESRAVFYQMIVERWRLTRTAEDLEKNWFANFDRFSVPENDLFDVLEKLSAKYKLGVVTNGAPSMQNRKIDALGIRKFFHSIVISGELGISKPDERIFLHACKSLGVAASEAVFVGDNYEKDVIGAENAGLRAVWLKKFPSESVHQNTVNALSDILQLLI